MLIPIRSHNSGSFCARLGAVVVAGSSPFPMARPSESSPWTTCCDYSSPMRVRSWTSWRRGGPTRSARAA